MRRVEVNRRCEEVGMAERTRDVSRPWWARVRFRLRVLIVVVLAIGGSLGWIVNRARVQREAVAAIRRAGGFVAYDWEWQNRRGNRKAKPSGPRWFVEQLGVDYLNRVVYVGFQEPMLDDVLAQMGRLGDLEMLYLQKSHVNDASMVHLSGLTQLRILYLDGNRITDAGLARIERLDRLEELSLGGTAITDEGLAHLRRLTRLKQLYLSATPITGSGFVHLEGLKQLDTLSLTATRLDDAGMAHLESLISLRSLNLQNDTRVTSIGLRHLKGLTKLQELSIRNVKFSSGTLAELRRALPKLKMDY
jgi:hypothetical protein